MNEYYQREYPGEEHVYTAEKLKPIRNFWQRHQWQIIAFIAIGLALIFACTTFILGMKLLLPTPSPSVKTDGSWQGQFTYNPGEPYSIPFQATLEIPPHQGNAVAGTLSEPDLGNTTVSVDGTEGTSDQMNPDQLQYVTRLYGNGTGTFITFTDPAYTQGNQVQLGCSYIAVLYSDGSLHGVWFYPGSTQPDGTFILYR
jgi:hypothetical protein